jgi:nucleotide-binding universal stress UspA family protein
MKILTPTDFSDNASHAIRYASVIARATNAQVKVMSVCPPLRNNMDVSQTIIEKEIARIERDTDIALRDLCHALREESDISYLREVRTGGTVDEIVKTAIDDNVDMIAMGTRGARGMQKFLFGSNTAEVIESTPCPVLAVPFDVPVKLPKKIVFATNYHDSDMRTLKELCGLVDQIHGELTILHVAKKNLKSDRDLIEQFSKAVAHETGLSQPFYYVLPHENVQEGINSFIESTGADLIAVSTRKRKIYERLFDASLTKQIAYQARLPLLAFHAASNEVQMPDE